MDSQTLIDTIKQWASESSFRVADKVAGYEFKSQAAAEQAEEALRVASKRAVTRVSGKFEVRGTKVVGKELLLRVGPQLDQQGPVLKALGRPHYTAEFRGDSVVIG